MNEPPQPTAQGLSRQDLLNAIDFEITHRESTLTRLGISAWGLALAVGALLWAAAIESINQHNWTNVSLVFLAGTGGLSLIAQRWVNAISAPREERSPRGYTFREYLAREGGDPDTLIHRIVLTVPFVGVGVFVALRGFVLAGAATSIFAGLVLLQATFFWVSCQVALPIGRELRYVRLPIGPRNQFEKFRQRHKAISYLLQIVVFLLTLNACVSIWPPAASDLKLGLMLSGLGIASGISIGLLRPPTTAHRLRLLRSKLSLGEIDVEVAKWQLERILHASPEESFLNDKAEEITAELKEYMWLCESVGAKIERTIALADEHRVEASKEGPAVQSASELSAASAAVQSTFVVYSLFMVMLKEMTAMTMSMSAATKSRAELQARVRAANYLFHIPPATLSAITERVEASWSQAGLSRQKIRAPAERFKPALSCLLQIHKGIIRRHMRRLSDAYDALILA